MHPTAVCVSGGVAFLVAEIGEESAVYEFEGHRVQIVTAPWVGTDSFMREIRRACAALIGGKL